MSSEAHHGASEARTGGDGHENDRPLDSMAHRARTAPLLARRARIVLACATGLDNTTVARKLRMSQPTVGRWRQRFIDKRLDGLLDEPRPGAPRTITDTQVEDDRDAHARKCAASARRTGVRAALVESRRRESDERASDLAGLRPAAASNQDVQALARSAADRQDSRHRRACI